MAEKQKCSIVSFLGEFVEFIVTFVTLAQLQA